MPIDPNIALGVKPIQLESPVNQMAKVYEMQNAQQSNQLNQMKMDEYQRGIATSQRRNALLGGFTSDMSVNDKVNKLVQGGFLDEAKSLAESEAKVNADKRLGRTADLDALSKAHNIYKTTVGGIIGNPTQANAIARIRRAGRLLNEDTSDDEAEVMALGENPDAIRQWAANLALEADKLLPKTERVDTGGAINYTNVSPVTGMPTVIGTMQKTVSPDTVYNAAKPVYSAEAGGFVTPPTASSPKGGFTPLNEVQATKDVNANRKALKTAGYDPETGLDKISGLIEKSTGSWTGAATDAALGGVFGVSTEGSKAIQQLKTFASTITTDLLGGKLGAGISNTDREFILEGLGNIADNTKPVGDRLAAWNAVKDRMISAGMFSDKQSIIPKNEKMPAVPSNASAAKKAKFEAFQRTQNKANAR